MSSALRPLVVALVTAGLFGVAGTACKLQLTPESLSKAYTGIKNAKKDLTPENEYYVGRSVATNLLARHDYKYLDAEALRAGELAGLTAYVNNVGNVVALAALATPRDGDRPAPRVGPDTGSVEGQTINGADRFRRQFRWPYVRPELLRLAKRGTNNNCQQAVHCRRLT